MATGSSSASPLRLPLWAKIVLAVAAGLVLVALGTPYFLNIDRYRNTIAGAITDQTGRHVTLGKIRARFLPEIGFVVQDLHISNPEGFPDGDLISAAEIRGNLAIRPLLHGIIHLNSFELVNPKLTLLTDGDGKDNYTFAAAAPLQTKQEPAPSGPAQTAGPSSGLGFDQIDAIKLTGAEVLVGTVIRGTVAPLADTKGISVTLHDFAVGPMRLHDWQAESKLSGVTLALSGWREPIEFQSGQFTLSDGKLDAQFVADLATASEVRGTLSVPDFEHPQVNFEMSASQLDIDKLIVVAGGASTAQTPLPANAPPKPANTPGANGELVARGHINVEKITTRPYVVGPANVEIRVYTDRAELWPISIGMYGGTLQISSRVDRVTNPARFTANVQLRNLDVAKVVDVNPSARGKISGIGELDLQLLGNLSDTWRKSLTGTGKFAVRNGHLPGVNLNSVAGSLAKLAGVGGDTPFTVLEGDLNIASQRVSSKLIHLDSPSGIVDLHGSVGLDSTLDYQGTVTLNPAAMVRSSGLGGVLGGLLASRVGKITVPFTLAGTIEKPKVQPGKGVTSSGPTSSSSDTAPSTTQSAAPQNPGDALKNIFKKH
jgi:uncharacterized protein involved in outer membrane biogenesis